MTKNFAGPRWTYDEQRDAYIPDKPRIFPSWVLDEETCLWTPPIARPNTPDESQYLVWDEKNIKWVLFDSPVSNSDVSQTWDKGQVLYFITE